jgi:hypothetical protein
MTYLAFKVVHIFGVVVFLGNIIVHLWRRGISRQYHRHGCVEGTRRQDG